MSRIIAVANAKGGVGKTTSAVNLSAALAELGYRVLAIDLDPQSSMTLSLGMNPLRVPGTICNLLTPGSDFLNAPIIHLQEQWDLIPSNEELHALEHELDTDPKKIYAIGAGLYPFAHVYDYIILDCPASIGVLTGAALAAADQVVIPLTPDFLAFQVSAVLFRVIRRVQETINPQLQIAGIFLTMYDTRTKHAREILTHIRKTYGASIPFFSAVIYQSVRLKEAPSQGQSIIKYAPQSQAARAYRVLAHEIVEGIPKSRRAKEKYLKNGDHAPSSRVRATEGRAEDKVYAFQVAPLLAQPDARTKSGQNGAGKNASTPNQPHDTDQLADAGNGSDSAVLNEADTTEQLEQGANGSSETVALIHEENEADAVVGAFEGTEQEGAVPSALIVNEQAESNPNGAQDVNPSDESTTSQAEPDSSNGTNSSGQPAPKRGSDKSGRGGTGLRVKLAALFAKLTGRGKRPNANGSDVTITNPVDNGIVGEVRPDAGRSESEGASHTDESEVDDDEPGAPGSRVESASHTGDPQVNNQEQNSSEPDTNGPRSTFATPGDEPVAVAPRQTANGSQAQYSAPSTPSELANGTAKPNAKGFQPELPYIAAKPKGDDKRGTNGSHPEPSAVRGKPGLDDELSAASGSMFESASLSDVLMLDEEPDKSVVDIVSLGALLTMHDNEPDTVDEDFDFEALTAEILTPELEGDDGEQNSPITGEAPTPFERSTDAQTPSSAPSNDPDNPISNYRASEIAPDDVDVWIKRAENSNARWEALSSWLHVLHLNPLNSYARTRLDELVRAWLEIATREDKDELLKLGNTLVEAGQFQIADETYLRVITLDPRSHRAWLGRALLAQNPLDRLVYVQRGLELSPGDPEVQNALAEARDRLDAEATRLLEEGLRLAHTGRTAQAHVLFKHTIELAPRDDRAWLGCARTADNLPAKLSYLKQALLINPQNAEAQDLYRILTNFMGTGKRERWALPATSPRILYVGVGLLVLVLALVLIPIFLFR